MNIRISILFFFTIFFFNFNSYSQDSLNLKKYREDQFYFSGNYVLIKNNSDNLIQSDFSNKISFGFIRDIPISENGRWALGIGLGGSYTQFKSNLDFQKGRLLSNNFKTTRFFSSVIPIELRWRSSSNFIYNFWRVYFGHQINYNFINDDSVLLKWNNTLTLNFGYNTWNFSLGYDVSPRTISSLTEVSLKRFKLLTVGIVFYIL
tara:strand:+ start:1652 stop:2266 length:615 start_codon:yes stop_codon:yes gene_type:complete